MATEGDAGEVRDGARHAKSAFLTIMTAHRKVCQKAAAEGLFQQPLIQGGLTCSFWTPDQAQEG
jgi:hypothetical protein